MSREVRPTQLRIVTVGDSLVGKTSLIYTYLYKEFQENFIIPFVCGDPGTWIKLDETIFYISIIDTSANEMYDKLRPLNYPSADCIVVCYSISDKNSFTNVEARWYPEIKRVTPIRPILLVGTKSDLRKNTEEMNCVTTDERMMIKEKIKAATFIECSSRNEENVQFVFEEAVRAWMNHIEHKEKKCIVL